MDGREQVLEQSPAAFPGAPAGSWIGSGIPRNKKDSKSLSYRIPASQATAAVSPVFVCICFMKM